MAAPNATSHSLDGSTSHEKPAVDIMEQIPTHDRVPEHVNHYEKDGLRTYGKLVCPYLMMLSERKLIE
jgi:hypothetical protein